MSFAMKVKEEILEHTFSKEQTIMLLSGFIKYNGELISLNENTVLKLFSYSNNVIRKIYALIKEIYVGNIEVSIIDSKKLKRKKIYQLLLTTNVINFLAKYNIYDIKKSKNHIEIYLNSDETENYGLTRAYISGVFIAVGSVNSPQTTNYHVELQTKEPESAKYLCDLLNQFDFGFKVTTRKKKFVCYAKKSLVVSDFLKFVDAAKAVLMFENTRISRDVNNNVNRMLNIEIYNQQKTYNAGIKQVRQISHIMEKNMFDELSKKAQVLAQVRLENPEATFSELGEILNEEKNVKITKSGISNLFKIIERLSESIGE